MVPDLAKTAKAEMVASLADLGSAIRRMRTTAGLTQTAFGKRVGLTQSKVARVEIGAPEVSLDLMMRAYIAAHGRPDFCRGGDPNLASPVVM